MNSTLESYPFLKNRLSKFDFSYSMEFGNTKASETASDSLNIDISSLNISITEPLVTLVQNACRLVENAKKTGDNNDIEEAGKAISLIYDDYCLEELEYELKNLKKSFELPERIAQLEDMFEQNEDQDALLKEASKIIRDAMGSIKFYPENDRKAELKNKLAELEGKLKGIYTYQDVEVMVSQLQEEAIKLESSASQVESFLSGLYEFRKHFKSVSSILGQSLLNRQEKKVLKARLKEIANVNTTFDERIVNILNHHLVPSDVLAVLCLINEIGYHDVIESGDFGDYFVQENKDRSLKDLTEWKQIINETVGLYLITHAANHEQLNSGILYFEYVPYINLGKERLEVCGKFFKQHKDELKDYQSLDDVAAVIQPMIDERNNKVQRVNEASTPTEMLETLQNIFIDLDINELDSKYVWLRKEKRAYRGLNQIGKDIGIADEEEIASIQKNYKAIEINGEDNKLRFITSVKDSSDTLRLLD